MSDPSVVSRPAEQPANGEERRRAPRYSLAPPMPCQVVALAVGPLTPSAVDNASVGGLALLLPRAVEPGTPLTVHLAGPRRRESARWMCASSTAGRSPMAAGTSAAR